MPRTRPACPCPAVVYALLQPFNPAYNELVIKGDDLNRLHIAGRVVETKAKW